MKEAGTGDNSPKEFDWSTVQSAEVLEESRAYRFQPEWRPLLLQFLGLTPGMHVLEVGCGPGTLAPYLAEAITPGRVTGVDLDAGFIARARKKAALAGVTNVEYVVADAYHLPFPDDTFDAVTSYTTLGVLKDPENALGEMIRVCRPGGTVSVAEGVAGPQGICFEGVDYLGHPCYGQERRYWELSQKVRRLVLEHLLPRQGLGSSHWPARSFFALLSRAGLEGVRVHAWGCCRAPDDARLSPQERVRLREQQYRVAREQLESLWRSGEAEVLFQHGLTPGELEELIQLCEARFRWSLEHPLYDWEASLSVVVAGQKPRRR
ncbi:MAG: methyltransferase domain-containing protein [Bacillota bacterium]|nr:methyltransferase domain-containing protein [Bacillota bacterium]MDI7250715.1 methyltransferase domain-containing protein [Bacillota bacterium]